MHHLPRATVACVTALAITSSSFARADNPLTQVPEASSPAAGSKTPAATRTGVVVIAGRGAENAAWSLAKEVYARDSLRPAGLDETRARVLVGTPPPPDAPTATRDLADERAGVHGDDGASRALLMMIASQLGVRGVVLVETNAAGDPSARVFLVDAQAFDAAHYAPDAAAAPLATATIDAGAPAVAVGASDGGMNVSSDAGAIPLAPPPAPPAAPPLHWSGTVTSIERTFSPAVGLAAPALALAPLPPEKAKPSESHPFYTSPWFWGAVGAAVFGGTAVYFATRDNSTSTIHLDLQVPK